MQLAKYKISNVPDVVFCGENGEELVVIEEYIHGNSLKKMMEQEGLFSEKRVIDITLQLCAIVKQLHDCVPPVIHRDIKPSNIMLSNDGVVKLIDFNAAKQFNRGQNEDTRLMGTQKFAAPEQYGFGQSDQRTDIYGIGVTMHYLLTGCFPGETVVSGKLNRIINRCVSLSKEERYQTVDELVKDLTKGYEEPKSSTSAKKGNIFTRSLYGYKKFLPVGFRSGKIWKMLLAIYGYLFLFSVWKDMGFNDENGEPLQGTFLMGNRIAAFAIIFGTVAFLGNYGGVYEW